MTACHAKRERNMSDRIQYSDGDPVWNIVMKPGETEAPRQDGLHLLRDDSIVLWGVEGW